jgi:hypothetical protein
MPVNKKIAAAEKLARLIACDILDERPCNRMSGSDADLYAGRLIAEAAQAPLVYTAFDGDHQLFCSHMRQRVISDGGVPVNPDSVLGYKDTVSYRQTKHEVLLDDLSVLRGCDELWVFTDLPIAPVSCVPRLAEGVLVEILYFKRRYPERRVLFCSLTETLMKGAASSLREFPASYDEIVRVLDDDQRDEVLRLANSGTKVDQELRQIKYYLFDPLDYKYARFVRAHGYSEDSCPIVPYLAVRPEDFEPKEQALTLAVIHWAKLMSLASSCVMLPPLDSKRSDSQIVEVLKRVWLRRAPGGKLNVEKWSAFHVPKAKQKDKWAITQRERNQYDN